MNPQITINISIYPDGVRISNDSKAEEVTTANFAVPPVPIVPDEETDGGTVEVDFALPVPEEDFDVVDEGVDFPPPPDDE